MVDELRPEDVSWKEAQRIRRKRWEQDETDMFRNSRISDEVSVEGDLNLHFVIIINPNVQHSVMWFKTDSKVTKEFVFDSFKKIAKAAGDQLMICDGILYQYDSSNGKWLKQRWEDVVFEPQ